MGIDGPRRYVPPTFTSRVKVTVYVTDQDVTVQVWDLPVNDLPPAQLWIRRFDRPEGKSEADCVKAATHALGAGLAGWIDLIGQQDQPLDGVEW